jgi:hypothetical protein
VKDPNSAVRDSGEASGQGSAEQPNLPGRHLTALEKFEFDQKLRAVVSELLQPVYD